MKKYITTILLLIATNLVFADSKITELPELTAPTTSDLLVAVDDVAGTPTTKKLLIENLLNIDSAIDHVNLLSTGTNTHAEIDSWLSDLDTSTTTLQGYINDLWSSTSTLEGYIFDLWDSTASLESRVVNLEASTSTLEGYVFDLWVSTANLETRVDALEVSTATLEASIVDLQTSTSTLEGYIFDLWISTASLDSRVTIIETDIINLETSTSTLEGYIFDLWDSTASLDSRVTDLEASTSTLEGYIFDLWVSTSVLEGYIFDLWDSTATLEAAVELNTIHRTSDGSDHTFIDQDVTITATPTFLEITISTINVTNGYDELDISTNVYANDIRLQDFDDGGETISEILNDTLNMLILDAISVSDDGGLNISWTSGEIWDGTNAIDTDADSGVCTDNSTNYLVWASGTGLTLKTANPLLEEVTVAHISCQDGDIWEIHVEQIASTLTRALQHGGAELAPILVSRGLVISEDTDIGNDLDVILSAGEYYHDFHQEHNVPQIISSSTFMRRWYHSSGSWTSDANAEIDNTQYDDGSDLVAAPLNQYMKSVFFCSETEIHWVYPNETYPNLASALVAPEPSLPSGLEKFPKLTSLVMREGWTDFSNATFEDARPILGVSGGGGAVSDHGSLSGLTDSEDHPYAVLIDGTRELTADWDAGAFEISIQSITAPSGYGNLAISTYTIFTDSITINGNISVSSNNKINLEGSNGDTYFIYDGTSVQLYVNNTLVREWSN